MAPSRRTWFDERGLVLDEGADGGADASSSRRLDLFLGSLHYWRTPPASRQRCLAALRALGCTAVETPVPWHVHETAAGRFEWKAERDLARFLELCREEDLAAVLRVGPCVGAELNGLGFPDDVLHDAELSARTAHGSPAWLPAPPRSFPIPSYGSAKFLARVASWYQAIGEAIGARRFDPVVALVVDADAPHLYRGGAYDLDYHPDVLARWTAAHPEFPEPPRRWDADDEARCRAWVRFGRAERARSLAALHAALDDAGFAGMARLEERALGLTYGATTATATLPTSPSPRSAAALPALSSQGPFHPAALRRAALRAFPSSATASLPFALESGVGEAAWMPPTGGAAADRDRALTLLAAGARALGFATAVERERWSGGLIEPDGTRAPDASWAAALLSSLRDVDWPSLRRRAAFAIVTSAAADDLAHASALVDPMTPDASARFALGPAGHGELGAAGDAHTAHRWRRAVEQALERAGLAYACLDARATADELAAYRVLLVPLGARVERALWSALRELAEQRRAIVVLGPVPPTLDEHGQPLGDPPLRRAGKMRPGSLDDLDGLAADLAQLAPEPPAWRADHALLSLFHAADGVSRAVFLHNDLARPVTARVHTGDATVRALRDAITGERILLSDGQAAIDLSASSLRMLLMER